MDPVMNGTRRMTVFERHQEFRGSVHRLAKEPDHLEQSQMQTNCRFVLTMQNTWMLRLPGRHKSGAGAGNKDGLGSAPLDIDGCLIVKLFVAKEPSDETRTATSPDAIKRLAGLGIETVVEAGAGQKAG